MGGGARPQVEPGWEERSFRPKGEGRVGGEGSFMEGDRCGEVSWEGRAKTQTEPGFGIYMSFTT